MKNEALFSCAFYVRTNPDGSNYGQALLTDVGMFQVGKTITNDAENVLKKIFKAFNALYNDTFYLESIIYCGTDAVLTEIVFNEHHEFERFNVLSQSKEAQKCQE